MSHTSLLRRLCCMRCFHWHCKALQRQTFTLQDSIMGRKAISARNIIIMSRTGLVWHCCHRGAGEMKGITMEDNKKQLAALKKLLEQPGNRNCADCAGGGAASRATWASINTGVFICMRCAGT